MKNAKHLRFKCPLDCVDCALEGYALIEPPAEKIHGTEGILMAKFRCAFFGGKIDDVFIHSFPEDKLQKLLEEREKILKILEQTSY